jgi:hypothetical protein
LKRSNFHFEDLPSNQESNATDSEPERKSKTKTVVNDEPAKKYVYQVSRMGSSQAQNIHSINLDNDIVNLLLLLTFFFFCSFVFGLKIRITEIEGRFLVEMSMGWAECLFFAPININFHPRERERESENIVFFCFYS